MKPTELKSALEQLQNLGAEKQSLENQIETTSAELVKLETTCNLADETALNKICRLQVLQKLFPSRLAAREAAIIQSEQDLQSASENFIRSTLGPRLRDLAARAKAKVKAQLKSIFPNEDDLEEAVSKATIVVELEPLSRAATIRNSPSDGVIKYAESLLKAWKDSEAIEAKL